LVEKLFSTVQKSPSDALAQLLLGAQMIDRDKLSEAQKSAKRLDVPLDKALLMLKSTSETNLRVALTANEMVVKGKIALDLAIRALIMAKQNGIAFEDAINVMGTVIAKTQQISSVANPLVDLLLGAQLVGPTQIAQLMQQASEAEMSICRTLIVNRCVTRSTLHDVLTALGLIKEEKIDRFKAEGALHTGLKRRLGVLQVLFEQGDLNDCSGETLKLAELVAMTGFLSESDYLDCLEISVCQDKPFGQALLEQNLFSLPLLEAACSLLDMVGNHLRPFQAAEALKQVRAKGISVYQAIAELQPPPQVPQKQISFCQLIVEAGLASKEAVKGVIEDSEASTVKTGKELLTAAVLSELRLNKALRCYSLFKEGVLSADQAISLLASCKDDLTSIEDALLKAGWNVPARMHWSWT